MGTQRVPGILTAVGLDRFGKGEFDPDLTHPWYSDAQVREKFESLLAEGNYDIDERDDSRWAGGHNYGGDDTLLTFLVRKEMYWSNVKPNHTHTDLVRSGRTAEEFRLGTLRLIRILLENGSNPNLVVGEPFEFRDFQDGTVGYGPIVLAAKYGRTDVVKLLLQAGAGQGIDLQAAVDVLRCYRGDPEKTRMVSDATEGDYSACLELLQGSGFAGFKDQACKISLQIKSSLSQVVAGADVPKLKELVDQASSIELALKALTRAPDDESEPVDKNAHDRFLGAQWVLKLAQLDSDSGSSSSQGTQKKRQKKEPASAGASASKSVMGLEERVSWEAVYQQGKLNKTKMSALQGFCAANLLPEGKRLISSSVSRST